MNIFVFWVFCSLAVWVSHAAVTLEADRPFLRVSLYEAAFLKCCYRGGHEPVRWIKEAKADNGSVYEAEPSVRATAGESRSNNILCGTLSFQSAELEDTGFYKCRLSSSGLFSHGTYLQVYKPFEKMIKLRESTKNKILVAEGVLLLLCVLLPSAALLLQSKKQNRLEKEKVQKEEENIYQGLNLEDCCETYDQIERSQTQGPYEDVGKMTEEEEDIQLEKP